MSGMYKILEVFDQKKRPGLAKSINFTFLVPDTFSAFDP